MRSLVVFGIFVLWGCLSEVACEEKGDKVWDRVVHVVWKEWRLEGYSYKVCNEYEMNGDCPTSQPVVCSFDHESFTTTRLCDYCAVKQWIFYKNGLCPGDILHWIASAKRHANHKPSVESVFMNIKNEIMSLLIDALSKSGTKPAPSCPQAGEIASQKNQSQSTMEAGNITISKEEKLINVSGLSAPPTVEMIEEFLKILGKLVSSEAKSSGVSETKCSSTTQQPTTETKLPPIPIMLPPSDVIQGAIKAMLKIETFMMKLLEKGQNEGASGIASTSPPAQTESVPGSSSVPTSETEEIAGSDMEFTSNPSSSQSPEISRNQKVKEVKKSELVKELEEMKLTISKGKEMPSSVSKVPETKFHPTESPKQQTQIENKAEAPSIRSTSQETQTSENLPAGSEKFPTPKPVNEAQENAGIKGGAVTPSQSKGKPQETQGKENIPAGSEKFPTRKPANEAPEKAGIEKSAEKPSETTEKAQQTEASENIPAESKQSPTLMPLNEAQKTVGVAKGAAAPSKSKGKSQKTQATKNIPVGSKQSPTPTPANEVQKTVGVGKGAAAPSQSKGTSQETQVAENIPVGSKEVPTPTPVNEAQETIGAESGAEEPSQSEGTSQETQVAENIPVEPEEFLTPAPVNEAQENIGAENGAKEPSQSKGNSQETEVAENMPVAKSPTPTPVVKAQKKVGIKGGAKGKSPKSGVVSQNPSNSEKEIKNPKITSVRETATKNNRKSSGIASKIIGKIRSVFG